MVINEQALVSKVHYPQDTLPVWASGHATAGATLVVSLPGVANRTTYLVKAFVTTQAPASIQNMEVTIFDGTTTGYVEMVQTVTAGGFANIDLGDAPIKASAVNTAITVTVPVVAGGAIPGILLVGYQR